MAKKRADGEGTIVRRGDGRWQAQLSLGYGSDGRRKRRTVYGKTQREVKEKLDRLKQELTASTLADPSLSVEAYLERWLKEKARQVKPRTAELYRHYIRRHICPEIGRIRLARLTPLHVQTLIGDLADTTGVRTANIVRTLLFSALKQAVRWQLMPRNPVEAVDPLRESPRPMTLWSTEQVLSFLEVAREHRLYAAFYLLLAAGLRRGELLGLRWQDLQGNVLHIRQALSLVNNRITFSTPKTDRGVRRVAIAADALEVLARHRHAQATELALLKLSEPDGDLMFTSEVGSAMHPRNFSRTWKTLQGKAGVPRVRLHDLRHLHVSLLVRQGLDPRTIADRVGHTDPAFTLRRYSHMFESQRQAAALSVPSLLGHAEGRPN